MKDGSEKNMFLGPSNQTLSPVIEVCFLTSGQRRVRCGSLFESSTAIAYRGLYTVYLAIQLRGLTSA